MINPVLIRNHQVALLFNDIAAVNLFHPVFFLKGKNFFVLHIIYESHKQIVLLLTFLKRRHMNTIALKCKETHLQRKFPFNQFRLHLSRFPKERSLQSSLLHRQILLERITLPERIPGLTSCKRHNLKLQAERTDLLRLRCREIPPVAHLRNTAKQRHRNRIPLILENFILIQPAVRHQKSALRVLHSRKTLLSLATARIRPGIIMTVISPHNLKRRIRHMHRRIQPCRQNHTHPVILRLIADCRRHTQPLRRFLQHQNRLHIHLHQLRRTVSHTRIRINTHLTLS